LNNKYKQYSFHKSEKLSLFQQCQWGLYYKYKQYSFHKHRNSPYLASINEVTAEVWRVSLFVKTILFIFVIQTSLILSMESLCVCENYIVYICNTNLIDTKYGEFLCLWKLYCLYLYYKYKQYSFHKSEKLSIFQQCQWGLYYKYKQYSFHKHRNSPYLASVCENYIAYICYSNLIDTS
jgi:hypothetical protein